MNKRGVSSVLVIICIILPLFLIAVYFVFDHPILRMLSLAFAVALTLLDFLYFPRRWSSSFRRFDSHLDRAQSSLFTESLSHLKEEYQKLYHQYEKLPESHKERCYSPLIQIRSKIEDLIQTVKKLETLVQEIGQGTVQGQQQRYEEMNRLFQKLPRKEQKQWYPHLRHARELLEKGPTENT